MATAIDGSGALSVTPASGASGRRRPTQDLRMRVSRLGVILLRAAAAASALGGVMVFVIAPIRGVFTGEFEDFGAYVGAAHAVAQHGDIYAPFLHQPVNVALSGFDYPPAVALMLSPLAAVPEHLAAMLWLWLIVACTGAASYIAAVELLPRSWPRLELAALATFAYSASTYNFWHGQMNPVIFLLLALALRDWIRGHQVRCGVIIGVAAAIKLAPIVLLVLLVRRGWWRGAFAGLATVAASVVAGVAVLGLGTTREYVTSVVPVLTRQDGWLYNQSVSGTVNRLFGHSVLTVQPASMVISLLTVGVVLLMLGALVAAVKSGERAAHLRGAEFGAGLLVMLLAGTITWYAHYVSLIIAVFAVLGLLAAERRLRTRLVTGATVALLVSAGVVAPIIIASVGSWQGVLALSHSSWWWLISQTASLPAVCAVVLCLALCWSLATTRRKTSATTAVAPRKALRA